MLTTLPLLTHLSDADLLRLCQQQAPHAFDTLMRRYLKAVYSYVYHYTQHVELAEDLTQETFLRVYRALGRFDTRRPFKPWLFTIATNACKSALRKQRTGDVLLSERDGNISLLENQADPHTIEATAHDESLQATLHTALGRLSPSVRQALLLRHVYDLSCEDVAAMLQANLNTVKTWLRRGRESLKDALIRDGGV